MVGSFGGADIVQLADLEERDRHVSVLPRRVTGEQRRAEMGRYVQVGTSGRGQWWVQGGRLVRGRVGAATGDHPRTVLRRGGAGLPDQLERRRVDADLTGLSLRLVARRTSDGRPDDEQRTLRAVSDHDLSHASRHADRHRDADRAERRLERNDAAQRGEHGEGAINPVSGVIATAEDEEQRVAAEKQDVAPVGLDGVDQRAEAAVHRRADDLGPDPALPGRGVPTAA